MFLLHQVFLSDLFPQLSHQKHFIRLTHKLDKESPSKNTKRKRTTSSGHPKAYRDEEDEPEKKHSKADDVPKSYKDEESGSQSPKKGKTPDKELSKSDRSPRKRSEAERSKRPEDQRHSRYREHERTRHHSRTRYEEARTRGRPILGRREESSHVRRESRERASGREGRSSSVKHDRIPEQQGYERENQIERNTRNRPFRYFPQDY